MTSLFEMTTAERLPASMVTELVARVGRDVSLLEFGPLAVEDLLTATPVVEVRVDEAAERAAQVRVMVDAARKGAAAEAREEMRAEVAAELALGKERVRLLEEEFASARARYFCEAEGEVVRLALAIARKVLGREAAADAMHLGAIVRVALGKVQDGSASVLRVPSQHVQAWRELAGREVEVVGDERVGVGEVRLETSVGCVELGVRGQMAEVERGFGELGVSRG